MTRSPATPPTTRRSILSDRSNDTVRRQRSGGEYQTFRPTVYEALTGADDREDIPFYVEHAREADGPVLELACGTGRVYLELLEAGVDADGFDRSADTLAELGRSAAERGLDPAVWQADMTSFAVDRAYDLVICPFNAFQHLLTIDERLAALRRVHDALAPGGEFVFDVFVPDFELVCDND